MVAVLVCIPINSVGGFLFSSCHFHLILCRPLLLNWEPLPIPPVSRPRTAPPGLAPPLPRSLRVPSRSGDPREHNWDRPPPKAI